MMLGIPLEPSLAWLGVWLVLVGVMLGILGRRG